MIKKNNVKNKKIREPDKVHNVGVWPGAGKFQVSTKTEAISSLWSKHVSCNRNVTGNTFLSSAEIPV
jgi:hypothetical protein